MLGIDDIFTYLQEDSGKGIYEQGFNYYLTEGVLYIYPKWKAEKMADTVVHIHKVPEYSMVGMENFSGREQDGTLHILSNLETKNTILLDEAIENIGNSLLMMKNEEVIDKWRDTLEGDKYKIHDDNMIYINMDATIGTMVKQPYQPNYVESDENPYVKKSILSFGNGAILETGWQHAIPYTFKPGWPITYHYLGEGNKYTVIQGLCMSSVYTFVKIPNTEKLIFGITAKVSIRLPMYTNKSDNKNINPVMKIGDLGPNLV